MVEFSSTTASKVIRAFEDKGINPSLFGVPQFVYVLPLLGGPEKKIDKDII